MGVSVVLYAAVEFLYASFAGNTRKGASSLPSIGEREGMGWGPVDVLVGAECGCVADDVDIVWLIGGLSRRESCTMFTNILAGVDDI